MRKLYSIQSIKILFIAVLLLFFRIHTHGYTVITNNTLGSGTSSTTGNTVTIDSGYIYNSGFFTLENTKAITKLPKFQYQQMIQRTYLYMKRFSLIVDNLQKKGLLSSEDIENMNKKIILSYKNDCKYIEGKTSIKQWYQNSTQLVKNDLLSIRININVCFQPSFVNNINLYIDQVISHELGHYIYYFYDNSHSIFQNICWVGETKKYTCTKYAFVSDYAMLSSEEDYAESFSSWYLDSYPSTTNIYLSTKKKYFDQIVPPLSPQTK